MVEHIYAERLAAEVIEDNGPDGNFFEEGLESEVGLGYVAVFITGDGQNGAMVYGDPGELSRSFATLAEELALM